MATSATAGGPGAHGKQAGEAAYGLCYGTKTSQPRTPSEVVDIYKSHGITKMWLSPTPFSPTNEAVISVLKLIITDKDLKSKMNIFLYIDYSDFSQLADYSKAEAWVDTYISPRFRSVIRHVCVGDVIGSVDFTSSIFQGAMSNLKKLLPVTIKLSTIVKTSVLLGDSYKTTTRPSACELTQTITPKDLLQFQSLFVRIMPYFRIRPDNMSVDNCILKDGAPIYMHDMVDKDYTYCQAFDAMLDSICFALKKANVLGKVDIHVVSGWPTDGPTDWASKICAQQYISNLLQHIGKPTPMNNKPVDIFIYSMEDEDLLEEPVEEFKHLGAEPYLP